MSAAPAPKGVRAEILTDRFHAANGGLSDHVQTVVIVGPGIPKLHEASSTCPAVQLVRRSAGLTVAEPIAPLKGRIGYMASGAYVRSSGFTDEWHAATGTWYPIPLHDRSETPEEYRALSSD